MIAAFAAGVAALGAAGALLILRGLVPPRAPLAARFDELTGISGVGRGRAPAAVGAELRQGWSRLEAAAVRPGSPDGLGDRRADLAVAPLGADDWRRLRGATVLASMLGTVGLFLLATPSAMQAAGPGWSSAPGVVLAASGGVAAGWWAAEQMLMARARSARLEFRHAVGIYLELAAVSLAGGAGPAEAMRAAASLGSSRPFCRLRDTVAEAEVRLQSPYRALERLGTVLGVAELEDVGSSMALAEEQGAPIKGTLEAKAAAVASRLMSAEEARAESRSVIMSLPSVLMLSGFLLFLMYPFVAALIATTR